MHVNDPELHFKNDIWYINNTFYGRYIRFVQLPEFHKNGGIYHSVPGPIQQYVF